MPTNYHEEIAKLLDSAGLIDKTLSFGCEVSKKFYEGEFLIVSDTNEHGGFCIVKSDSQAGQREIAYEVSIDKILGHPWDLQTILLWNEKQGNPKKQSKIIELVYLNRRLEEQNLKPLWELMKSISDNK